MPGPQLTKPVHGEGHRSLHGQCGESSRRPPHGPPLIPSKLFAVSMDGKILGGRLWWIFMAVMSTFNWTACLFITQDPAKKALQTIDEEDEDELEEV